jgi:hypothetical protein
MNKAFISYSKDDRERAYRVSDALRAIGWSPFLDQEGLAPGIRWKKTLSAELAASDLLVIVLTEAWANSDFSTMELDAYVEAGKRAFKETIPIIPLEFEMVVITDHMLPQLHSLQVVKNAEELNHYELCWMLSCGVNATLPGPRRSWEEKGVEVTTSGVPPTPPSRQFRQLSIAERLQLENELSSRITSSQRIREIARKTFLKTLDVPSDPKIAWYKLIRMANDAGRIGLLCETVDVEPERLFGPSGGDEEGEG